MRNIARTLVMLAAVSFSGTAAGAAHAGEDTPPPPPDESCRIWLPDGGNTFC